MRRLLAPLLALLLLAACAAEPEAPSPDDYELYYVVQLGASAGGDAIRADTIRVENSATLDTARLAERLLTALLEEPEDATLRSPFPSGTSLQKLSVAGGRATVDLSEPYAKLSGIELSIADACVTLTLTQLEGIYAVRITANGRELPYRKTQLLTAADALLSSGEDVIRPINVSLYFLDKQSGELRAQPQTLALYEGQTRVSAVVDALKRGSAGDDTLQTLLGADFAIASSRIENSICYVNLNSATPLPQEETLRDLALESLARSLLSLEGVDEIQFLIDGESAPQWTATPPAPAEAAG